MRLKLLLGTLIALAFVSAALATVIVNGWNTSPPLAEEAPAIGGPFTLVDQNDRPVTEEDFRGSWTLVYFGYTYCPDVCPLGLQTIGRAMDLLPPAVVEQVTPIFITVDPERDTPQVLADYVPMFHPKLLGLTGTPEQVEQAKRAYRVYAKKAPTAEGDYLVDHSAFTFLMDPQGRYVTHFGHDVTAEEMAARIEREAAATS